MSVLAVFLRARHEPEPDHVRNPSFSQPLLHTNEESINNVGDVNVVNVPPKKVFNGRIQVKPNQSDNSTEDSTEFEEDFFLYQQFQMRYTVEDDPVVILHDNQCLSPTKPTAKSLFYFIYTVDFTFGSFLITRGSQEMRNLYSCLVCSLIIGILLVSGSVAGIFLHTPLRTWCYDDNGVGNRALTLLNGAFAFIAFGVYYVLSLLLLTSTKAMQPFLGLELGLATQFVLCLLGFTLSLGESYRVIFLQYHHHLGEERIHVTEVNNNNSTTRLIAESDGNIVENTEAVPAILFV